MSIPIQIQGNFSHLVFQDGLTNTLNVDSIIQDYIIQMNDSIAFALSVIIFYLFYSSTIHAFIIDKFSHKHKIIRYLSDRILNISEMLSRAFSVYLLWIIHKQGFISGHVYYFLVGVISISVLIFIYSLIKLIIQLFKLNKIKKVMDGIFDEE